MGGVDRALGLGLGLAFGIQGIGFKQYTKGVDWLCSAFLGSG